MQDPPAEHVALWALPDGVVAKPISTKTVAAKQSLSSRRIKAPQTRIPPKSRLDTIPPSQMKFFAYHIPKALLKGEPL